MAYSFADSVQTVPAEIAFPVDQSLGIKVASRTSRSPFLQFSLAMLIAPSFAG
jgi:hypothetical protein